MGFFSAFKKFFGQEPLTETKPAETPIQKAAPEPELEPRPQEKSGIPGEVCQEELCQEAASGLPEKQEDESRIRPVEEAADGPVPVIAASVTEPAESIPAPEAAENRDAENKIADQAAEVGGIAPADAAETAAKFEQRDVQEKAAESGQAAALENINTEPAPAGGTVPAQGGAGIETVEPAAAPASTEQQEPAPVQSGHSQEEAELIARLRGAEPRLSRWLDIVLEGQEKVNDRFWSRLRFLLRSLETPGNEAEAFLDDFGQWLNRMDYAYVDEFRSELQYRLALALDLEDEEDERNRLLVKLSQGLAATREKLGMGLNALFNSHGELNDAFWEELEELFIMADLGYDTALEITARLKKRAAKEGVTEAASVGRLLQQELEEIFRQETKIKAVNKPEVVLMMGVNGAGKTTTIAKMAHRERMAGKKVLVAAADTFRAAAIEQLQVWAERAGADFYARPAGSDPASVAWGAMDYALDHDIDVVFVDTAGRLQTRANLMEELGKIRQVLARKHTGAPHRNVLVLDATTGQNALSQAKLFREAAGADELILTKLDGTAKGGVAIAVAMQENLPITFIGLGEKMDDLRPFNGADFARALLDDDKRKE